MLSTSFYQLSFRSILVATIALSTVDCSAQSSSNYSQANATKLQWRKLPDGSFAEGAENPGSVTNWRRCWPASTGYDCIVATDLNRDGSIMRWQTERLSANLDDPDALPPLNRQGYACEYLHGQMSILETAYGPNGGKIQNVVSLNGGLPQTRPWSAHKASEALAQVGSSERQSHFDCLEIASQIFIGGIRAIEGASVTRGVLN